MQGQGSIAAIPRKPISPETLALLATVDVSEMNDDPIDDPDNPEWTEEDFARASGPESLSDVELAAFPRTKVPGRPRVEQPKVQISIRLEPDVLAALRARGPGWQRLANDILREGLRKRAR
jgi:uncharacterized protein (DUF4415 family)